MSGSTARRVLAICATVLAGIMAALVAGEIIARLTWRLPLWSRPRPRTPATTPVVYRKNALGFRGRDYTEQPAPGTFRIVIVGDSITMGAGVAGEDTYAARLEAALRRTSTGVQYEVLNLGVAGLDIHGVMNRLERLGLRLEPDLVVYGCTTNDIEGPAYRRTLDNPVLRAERRREALRFARSRSYLLRALWPRWVFVRRLVSPQPGAYFYDLRYNYFENEAAWNDFTAGLDRLAAATRERGICGHVLIHAAVHRLGFGHGLTPIYERIAAAAAGRGLTVTESLPYFRGHDPEALHVSRTDPHPNAAGHRILARALLDGLRSLPSQCWEQAGRRSSRD